jgi:hypothetical protein
VGEKRFRSKIWFAAAMSLVAALPLLAKLIASMKV